MPIIANNVVVTNSTPTPEPTGDVVVNVLTEEMLLKRLSDSTDALAATVVNHGGTIDENLDTVDIKWNQSVARMVRRKGQGAVRVHPFKLTINNQAIEVNDEIVFLINKLLIQI
jgi:hypothetical protein